MTYRFPVRNAMLLGIRIILPETYLISNMTIKYCNYLNKTHKINKFDIF